MEKYVDQELSLSFKGLKRGQLIIEYSLGLENVVVPLSFHVLSHQKDISKVNPDICKKLVGNIIYFLVGKSSLRSPSNIQAYYSLNTSPSLLYPLQIWKAVISAQLHPLTDIEIVSLDTFQISIQGLITFIAFLKILIPLAIYPLFSLQLLGSSSTPSIFPQQSVWKGPISIKNTNPLAIFFVYSLYQNFQHFVITSSNFPAAYAQSSKVPVAGYMTQSIVPISNLSSFLLNPPSLPIIFAILRQISYYYVWLLSLW